MIGVFMIFFKCRWGSITARTFWMVGLASRRGRGRCCRQYAWNLASIHSHFQTKYNAVYVVLSKRYLQFWSVAVPQFVCDEFTKQCVFISGWCKRFHTAYCFLDRGDIIFFKAFIWEVWRFKLGCLALNYLWLVVSMVFMLCVTTVLKTEMVIITYYC